MCGGWYVQAYRNVAGRSMAPSATIDPRLRKRPAPAAVLPNTTTVPAIIALPVRGPAFPVTTMSPRRAAAPARARAPRILAGASVHVDAAAHHGEAEVRPDVAGDEHFASGHAGADCLHPGEIAFDPDHTRALALDSEEVAERRPAAAVYDRQPGDLPLAQRGEPVRGDAVGHE